ncbi:hypothetical protein ACG3SL_19760 [Sphingomonas sp. CJ20]
MIDMTDWQFSIGGGRPDLVALGLNPPPVPLHFPQVLDLLTHLAAGEELPTGQIDKRLKASAAAMSWPGLYTRLKAAPHFKAYRGRQYDAYKQAAFDRAAGTATPRQLALANGLSAEIAASKVIVPRGQLVLHGRSDQLPTAAPLYHAYLSTSLSPFVARLSAIRRQNQLGGRQTIYLLTLARDLPAMWGHVGSSPEWELLFDAGLPVRRTAAHTAGPLDIIEASLG